MSPERAAEVTRNRQEALQRAGNNVSAAVESTLELHGSALFGAFTDWLGCPVRMCQLVADTRCCCHPRACRDCSLCRMPVVD